MHFRRMLPLVALAMLASPTIYFAVEGNTLSSRSSVIAILMSSIMVFIWIARFLRRKNGSAIVGLGGGFIVFYLLLALVGMITGHQDNQVQMKEVEEARCRRDLECWGNKNSLAATFKCQDEIEKKANKQAEWTDGVLGSKFSRFRWKDQRKGVMTFIGDKLKYQNGFGAWQYHSYQCDYDTQQDIAFAVRVEPGRLS